MGDYRLGLLNHVVDEFKDESFINESKFNDERAFTRSRVFTFEKLIVLIMTLRTSYQREINDFGKKLIKGDYNIKEASSSALTQARAKLNPYAFERLNEVAAEKFYEDAPYEKWNEFRLLAVDGSVLGLPSSQSVSQEFGVETYINTSRGPKSMARCSLLYDVLNQVTLNAQISGYRTSEKVLFEKQLSSLKQGDLVLADRGYAYIIILYWLTGLKVDFCFRLHDHKMNAVKDFIKSESTSKEIEVTLTKKERRKAGITKSTEPIKIRLIKVELDNGKVEILGTSLLDAEQYPIEIFKDLYHLRWGVEEAYKMLKSRIGLESFSGKTAISVKQDFHAKVFMMTLCATLSYPIDQKVKQEYAAAKTGNKHDQKINRTDAIAETKSNLINIFLRPLKQKIIDMMDKIIEASRTIIRPNRKNKRLHNTKKRKPLNYKRI